ncbi:hypothetical protein BC629DRAFT_1594525 [Irpex lacteus]|nr:hypothetical protein BC629DRAFT_1594525 [Irpex lacteus]
MGKLLRLTLVFTIPLQLVLAQNFAVPSTWRKPTMTLSLQERLSLVDGLVNTVNQTYNKLTGLFNGLDIPQSANMLCALAVGDRINNSTINRAFVLQNLNTTFGLAPTIVTLRGSTHQTSDAAIWGLAAINAYRAYKDPQSLQFAESTWDYMSQYLVTADDAISGTLPTKNATFPSTCHGASVAGAVFYSASDPNDTAVVGETVAAFMALSAHLYEQTSDNQYLTAAQAPIQPPWRRQSQTSGYSKSQ